MKEHPNRPTRQKKELASHDCAHTSTRGRRRRLAPTLLPLPNKRTSRRPLVLFSLQIHTPRKQHRRNQHRGTGPIPHRVHAVLAFESCSDERTDEGEDGDAGPHHASPLTDVTVPFVRDEVRNAGSGKGEHGAAEDAEEGAEGDGAAVVLGKGPEEEGEKGGEEAG